MVETQKKVVSRNVAIALGIICIVLAVGLVGAIIQINYLNSQISSLNSRVSSLQNQISSLNSQITKLQKTPIGLETTYLYQYDEVAVNNTNSFTVYNVTVECWIVEATYNGRLKTLFNTYYVGTIEANTVFQFVPSASIIGEIANISDNETIQFTASGYA
jgi:outer membrane murein-binding lipoprotein Lpp